MPQIKEIRKIESNIKEIKPEKKVESIDDEFNEEDEDIPQDFSFSQFRRQPKTATLETSDIPQTIEERQSRISKEDQKEINFTPTYTSTRANPYKSSTYTPVGSAESGVDNNGRRSLGQRDLDRGGDLERAGIGQTRSDQGGMNYAGQSEQERRDKRRDQL